MRLVMVLDPHFGVAALFDGATWGGFAAVYVTATTFVTALGTCSGFKAVGHAEPAPREPDRRRGWAPYSFRAAGVLPPPTTLCRSACQGTAASRQG